MSKWATIDAEKLELEIQKVTAQIQAISGEHPEKMDTSKKRDMQTVVIISRLMATRDALVLTHNCLARAEE